MDLRSSYSNKSTAAAEKLPQFYIMRTAGSDMSLGKSGKSLGKTDKALGKSEKRAADADISTAVTEL